MGNETQTPARIAIQREEKKTNDAITSGEYTVTFGALIRGRSVRRRRERKEIERERDEARGKGRSEREKATNTNIERDKGLAVQLDIQPRTITGQDC